MTRDSSSTAELYEHFSAKETLPASPLYSMLAAGVSRDPAVLGLLDQLPLAKRQPNLLFAAVRYLYGTPDTYVLLRDVVRNNWSTISATMRNRRTQTNEPARCGALLPAFARIPEPLALIEVGPSAGLCLYPDRYRYDYSGHLVGADSQVLVSCRVTGDVPLPAAVPEVAWRGGVDLHPLDVTQADDVRWLECLIWPEEEPARLPRLHAATRIAAADPPHLVAGDLLDLLPHLIVSLPDQVTPVVFHSAVATYLSHADRARFIDLIAELPGHWVSQEDATVFPAVAKRLREQPPADEPAFLLALDGEPLAFSAPHGGWLHWL